MRPEITPSTIRVRPYLPAIALPTGSSASRMIQSSGRAARLTFATGKTYWRRIT